MSDPVTPASPAPPPAAPPASGHDCPACHGSGLVQTFPGTFVPCFAGCTPPASSPQEAATPVGALAAELEKIARGFEDDRRRCEADGDKHAASVYSAVAVTYRADAQRVRELAPAWDALAAENERLRLDLHDVRADRDAVEVQRNRATAECERLRVALEGARVKRDANGAGLSALRVRLGELADHWNREYASETGWPSRCAIELREVLEARDA